MSIKSAPVVLETPQFSHEVAEFILHRGKEAIAARGLFRLALAGGQTPAIVYSEMAKADFPWDKVQFTFGDERCVPPDHADSNYRMAKESLFDKISLPDGNVFRIRGEIDPAVAAQEYETKLAAVAARFDEPIYRHDLVLLGLGPDGHTASLFPGSPALDETKRFVIPTIGPKPPPQRITLTFPILNAARNICFMVNDPAKRPVIDEILAGHSSYPAARIAPLDGHLIWLLGA